jgi:hypothetical protein
MKKLLAVGMILLSTSAWAEWVEFSKNQDGSMFFIDPATKKGGSRPRVWVWGIYAQPMSFGIRSFKSLREADCNAGRSRDLTVTYYLDIDAKSMRHQDTKPDEWSYPMPGTVEETFYIYLCDKAP